MIWLLRDTLISWRGSQEHAAPSPPPKSAEGVPEASKMVAAAVESTPRRSVFLARAPIRDLIGDGQAQPPPYYSVRAAPRPLRPPPGRRPAAAPPIPFRHLASAHATLSMARIANPNGVRPSRIYDDCPPPKTDRPPCPPHPLRVGCAPHLRRYDHEDIIRTSGR